MPNYLSFEATYAIYFFKISTEYHICNLNKLCKMHQRIIFIALVSIFSSGLKAQEIEKPRWYVKLGSGFGFKGFLPQEFTLKTILPSPNSLDPADGTVSDMTNNIDSLGQKSLIHDTYSKGINFYLGGGYKLGKNWGVELGLLWLQGGNITSHSAMDNNVLLGKGSTIDITTFARGLALTPSVTIDVPLSSVWYIQGRVGFTIPVYGFIFHHLDISAPRSPLGNSKSIVDARTQAGFSLGFNGGFGIHRRLGKHFDVAFDILAQHLNLNGKHLQIEKYTLSANGITTDMLFLYPGKYHSEVNFVKELVSGSNNKFSNAKPDENKPREELQVSSPFSSIGLAVGFSYFFGGNN
jgi:hypothetical protein